jgi:hypothetical protein
LNGTAKKAQLDGYSAAGKTGTGTEDRSEKQKAYSVDEVCRLVRRASRPVSNPQVVDHRRDRRACRALITAATSPRQSFREVAEQVLADTRHRARYRDESLQPDLIAQQFTDNPERAEKIREEQAQVGRAAESHNANRGQQRGDEAGEVVYA